MPSIALQQPVTLWDRRGKEIINGKIVTMAPVRPDHWRVSKRISSIFDRYFEGKSCEVFSDVIVHLTNGDKVAPDIAVVCDRSIVKENGIYGIPDLVVEVLSSSTAARDKSEKKDIYEKCGVKEYWIVDVKNRVIEVYVLAGKRYKIGGIYTIYDELDMWEMTDQEMAEIVTEFKTSLFDDLIISIEEVFRDIE